MLEQVLKIISNSSSDNDSSDNDSIYDEEEEEDYSPSSSAFESCSSDLTDDSTVVSATSISSSVSSSFLLKEEKNYRTNSSIEQEFPIFPPITLSFHEALSFNMLRLYQVRYEYFLRVHYAIINHFLFYYRN
jgi:hypothetical protein